MTTNSETFVSVTQSFFTKENAIAFVQDQNEVYADDLWENVEMHVDYTGPNSPDRSKFPIIHMYRVQLIYRKRQLELEV